jgi:hypothetical protein
LHWDTPGNCVSGSIHQGFHWFQCHSAAATAKPAGPVHPLQAPQVLPVADEKLWTRPLTGVEGF